MDAWPYILITLVASTIFCYEIAGWCIGRRIIIRWQRLCTYMAVVFAVMIVCEAVSAYLYLYLMGQPAWEYRMWPIHHGYTTGWAWLVWPFYGMYMYFLEQVLQHYGVFVRHPVLQGTLLGIDGIILEILVNLFTIGLGGGYYFYYFPGDLWHLSSVQAAPFYLASGVLLGLALWPSLRSHSWWVPAGWYAAGLAAFAALAYTS